MKILPFILLQSIVVTVLLIFLAGCATIQETADPEGLLRSTAVEYWKLRMAEKYEHIYKMEDREGLPSFEDYRNKVMAMRRIHILSHSVINVSVDGDKGLVDVEFSFSLPPTTKPLKQVVKEQWIYKDGRWLHRLPP